MSQLSANLKRIMKDKNIGATALIKSAKLPTSSFYSILSGKTPAPQEKTIIKLATALKVEPEHLTKKASKIPSQSPTKKVKGDVKRWAPPNGLGKSIPNTRPEPDADWSGWMDEDVKMYRGGYKAKTKNAGSLAFEAGGLATEKLGPSIPPVSFPRALAIEAVNLELRGALAAIAGRLEDVIKRVINRDIETLEAELNLDTWLITAARATLKASSEN